MLEIIKREISDLENVRLFYQKCNYDGGVKQEDEIFLARIEDRLVGVVRLCPEQNVLILRGMQVLPEFQGQGIGTQLLESCNNYIARRACYCIPWKHLPSFYKQIGFELISPAKLPLFLNQRLEEYLVRNMNVISMYKPNEQI